MVLSLTDGLHPTYAVLAKNNSSESFLPQISGQAVFKGPLKNDQAGVLEYEVFEGSG